MTTLFMHKKGERRNDKSRRAQQRKRDKIWARMILRLPEELRQPDGTMEKNHTREQYIDLAREILAKGGR